MQFFKVNYLDGGRKLYQVIEADSEEQAVKSFWLNLSESKILTIELLFAELWDAHGDIDTQAPTENILDKVKNIVYERSEEADRQYGSFPDGMARAAQIFNGWTGLNLEAEHVYKMLVALKFSRESYNKKYDNMLDALAYLTAYYEHYKQDYDKTK